MSWQNQSGHPIESLCLGVFELEPRRHKDTKEREWTVAESFFSETGRTVFESIPPTTEQVATEVVDAAFRVHSHLGPGLLESVYEACLCHEFSKRKLPFARQLSLPVTYDGVTIDAGLRIDLLVADCVIVELKAVEKLLPVHEAQVLTYLKLTGNRVGLLINFNVVRIKDGIHRLVR